MKIITIGRDEGCTITLDDNTVSWHHARLKLYPSGKMELIDESTNGTSINGQTMKSHKPYRVRRKDVITFAGRRQLIWSDVPDPYRSRRKAIIWILVILALLGGLYAFKDQLKEVLLPGEEVVTNEGGADSSASVDSPISQTEEPKAQDNKDQLTEEQVQEAAYRGTQKALKEEKRRLKKEEEERKKKEAEERKKIEPSELYLYTGDRK